MSWGKNPQIKINLFKNLKMMSDASGRYQSCNYFRIMTEGRMAEKQNKGNKAMINTNVL